MYGLFCIFLTFAARRAAMNSSRFFRQSPFFAPAAFPPDDAAAPFDAAAWKRDVNIIVQKVIWNLALGHAASLALGCVNLSLWTSRDSPNLGPTLQGREKGL